MKPLHFIFAAAMLLGVTVLPAQAGARISVDFFHDNLESYGDWREVGDYGYCWQPRDVDRDWRPYSDGRWLYTDAGWTWDSDEPYSWAVYHYGRWARVDRIGWVWVPGTEWGPAWVSWRRSPRHVGWAPLPPDAEFSRSVGFNARVDADYDIGPTNYSFVEVRNFGAPRLRTVIVEPRQNITIISQTTNITRITYVNNVVYNEGPQYDVISRESAQPIRRLRLERREEFDGDSRTVRAEQLRTTVEGDSFRVLAIPFDTRAATAPRKVAAKVEKAEVDRGWKNAGPPAEVAKLRTQIKSEPATPAAPLPHPKAVTSAEVPIPSKPVTEGKPPTGKLRNAAEPTNPAAPVPTEAAPPAPVKPIASDQPAKPGKPEKGAKSVKPEAVSPRPLPPTVEEPAPSSQFKKGNAKGIENPRPPAEVLPEAQPPGRKPKGESVAPTRALPPAVEVPAPSSQPKKGKNKEIETSRPPAEAPAQAQTPMRKKEKVEPSAKVPPAAVETPRAKIQPGKGDAQPKPEQPAARSIERNVPNAPAPRPEAKRPAPHEPAAPAVTQPQPPQPAKGKGKGKDEKKDAVKPDGVPQ